MNKSEFVERYNRVVNKSAELFDTPEHYKELIEKYEAMEQRSGDPVRDQISFSTIIARNYAENQTYNLLKEFFVDESD